MGTCFSKKLLPPELNNDSSEEDSESSEDSENASSPKKDAKVSDNKKTTVGSKNVPQKVTKGSTAKSDTLKGASAGVSSKGTATKSTKKGVKKEVISKKVVKGGKASPAGKAGTSKASSTKSSDANKSKTPSPSPKPPAVRIPAKPVTAEMKRAKTPNVASKVVPQAQTTAKMNIEPPIQTPQPPPPPLQPPSEQLSKVEPTKTMLLSKESFSPSEIMPPSSEAAFPQMQAQSALFAAPKEEQSKMSVPQQMQQQQPNPVQPQSNLIYQERPRVLQLNNGTTLNLPNSEDYNRQLNDALLQAQIRSYFEEMMAQMRLTQQMVQASPQHTQQPAQQSAPTQSPFVFGNNSPQQQPFQQPGSGVPVNQQQPVSSGAPSQTMPFQQQSSPSVIGTQSSAMVSQSPVPNSDSLHYIPSHNCIGNSSFIRPQATSSQLFPSLHPHPPQPIVNHHRPHYMKQQVQSQQQNINQQAFPPAMGFPVFPLSRSSLQQAPKTNVVPGFTFVVPPTPPPQQHSFFAPQTPFPGTRMEGSPPTFPWKSFNGTGGTFPPSIPKTFSPPPPPTYGQTFGIAENNQPFPSPTPVIQPTEFNFELAIGNQGPIMPDYTNEQVEAINRDIQELKKDIQDKEWNELMVKVSL